MNYKHWKTPLALAIILAVLSTLVFWNEFKRKPETEKKEEIAKKIFSLEGSPVSEITLNKNGKEKDIYSFACQDLDKNLCKPSDPSHWLIQSPVKAQADKSTLNSFLSSLSLLDSVEKIDLSTETPEKKEELFQYYGLSNENIKKNETPSVSIKTQNGSVQKLYFGIPHPIGGNIFVRLEKEQKLDENTVYLIAPSLIKNLENPLGHWRNKSLFSIQLSDINQFELKNKTNNLIQADFKNNEWMLTSGQSLPIKGDSEEIETFLNNVIYLNVKNFVEENKKSVEALKITQGAAEIIKLKLFLKNQKPIELSLKQKKVGADIRLYATVSHLDPLYEVDSATQNKFNKSIEDLRINKLISNVEKYSSQKIIFSKGTLGEEKFTMSKSKEGNWSLTEPTLEENNPNKIKSLLELLSTKKILKFQNKTPQKNELKNALELEIYGPEDQLLRKLAFWKLNENLFAFDLLSKQNEILTLDNALINELPWSKDYFLKKSEDKK